MKKGMKLNNIQPKQLSDLGVAVKPARLQLNMHPQLHEDFRKLSFMEDEKMSDLITEFVIKYVRDHGKPVDEATATMYLAPPKKWTLE